MKKETWDKMVAKADRLLLTPFEKLSKAEQKMWIEGTTRLLAELRGRRRSGRKGTR